MGHADRPEPGGLTDGGQRSPMEDRLLILKMLQEGKITAEEALALLEAVDEGPAERPVRKGAEGEAGAGRDTEAGHEAGGPRRPRPPEPPGEPGILDDVAEMVDEAVRAAQEALRASVDPEEVRRLTEEGRRKAREAIRQARGQLKASLRAHRESIRESVRQESGAGERGPLPRSFLEDLLGWIGTGILGSGYQMEEEVTGEFGPGEGPVTVRLHATNGRVQIHAADGKGYRVLLRKNIRARSEAEAAEWARDACRVTRGERSLAVEAEPGVRGFLAGVSIEAWLPRDYRYQLDLHSSNGRLVVEGLEAEHLRAETSNGRVVLTDLSAEVAEVRTSNGAVRLACSARRLEARTSNGAIEAGLPAAWPVEGEAVLDLATSNGRIALELPAGGPGYDLDASTTNGAVRVELPGQDHEAGGVRGRRQVRVRTADYDARPRRLKIRARTSNGSITVRAAAAGGDGAAGSAEDAAGRGEGQDR